MGRDLENKRQYERDWNKKYPEKRKEINNRSYQKHRKERLKSSSDWYWKHRDEVLDRLKRFNHECRVLNKKTKNYMNIGPNKPPRPEDNKCQICGRVCKRLAYHHWDDEHPERGIWICQPKCHDGCEFVESGFVPKYLQLKENFLSNI